MFASPRLVNPSDHLPLEDRIAPLRRYANFLAIGLDISEIDLRFGQSFGGAEAPLIHSWLVTTPVHLAGFQAQLDAAIARYRERFGPIPGLHSNPGGER
jgi:hypothetical protein